jgi:hypothetical protein
MWVVTREINQYFQDGEYFVSCFINKPNVQQLKAVVPRLRDDAAKHLLSGGGRLTFEDEWWNLHECSEGEAFV